MQTTEFNNQIIIENQDSNSRLLTQTYIQFIKRSSERSFKSYIDGTPNQFHGYRQQDAHEFLRYLLERIDTEH